MARKISAADMIAIAAWVLAFTTMTGLFFSGIAPQINIAHAIIVGNLAAIASYLVRF
jgi:xanthine/uracil permease